MNWELFISGFLSATLLPGSSEALLIYQLQDLPASVAMLLLSVTLGNVLGSLLTYAMGWGGNHLAHQQWLGVNQQNLQKAEKFFQKYGIFSLLLAWLPVVGDPLCLFAGLMRVHWLVFTMLVSIGKAVRYLAIAGLFAL